MRKRLPFCLVVRGFVRPSIGQTLANDALEQSWSAFLAVYTKPSALVVAKIKFRAIQPRRRMPPRGTARWRSWSRRETPRVRQVYLAQAARCECRERRQAPPFPRATSAASRRRRPRGLDPRRAAPDRETRRGLRADRDGR